MGIYDSYFGHYVARGYNYIFYSMCVCYHSNNIEAGGNQSASQKGKRVQAAPPNLYFPNPLQPPE